MRKMQFRKLSEQEVEDFQKWAEEEFARQSKEGKYAINGLWHPVVRIEMARLIQEEADEELWPIEEKNDE